MTTVFILNKLPDTPVVRGTCFCVVLVSDQEMLRSLGSPVGDHEALLERGRCGAGLGAAGCRSHSTDVFPVCDQNLALGHIRKPLYLPLTSGVRSAAR